VISLTKQYSILFYACEGGFVSCVKYLLENGSKIENKDYQPLCQVSLNYNPEIIRMLVNSGANVNVKDLNKAHLCIGFYAILTMMKNYYPFWICSPRAN
jgi:ankyrin repeat protein